jgi:hypothetical protein
VFHEIGIVINNNQTHYTAHFRGTKDEICHYIEDIQIPITVFWRYSNPDSTYNPELEVSYIVLVDPLTGLPVSEAVQTHKPPYYSTEYNISSMRVFEFNSTNTRYYMYPDDHDTWKYQNGPDKYSQRGFFTDTYSATKIFTIDNVPGSKCDDYDPEGLAYNVAYGILPSIEFSFCPVLRDKSGTPYNHCWTYQDYSTASFSFVPERIND